jgi:hypothetical protein
MRSLIVLLSVVLCAASAEARRLEVHAPTSHGADRMWGPVEIQVEDLREDSVPSAEGDRIGAGRVFSFANLILWGYGSSKKPMHLDRSSVPDLITQLVMAMAAENGILAEGAPTATPVGTLSVSVRTFGCENPARRDEECDASFGLALTSAVGGHPVWYSELSYASEQWEDGTRARSYQRMVDALASELDRALRKDSVRGLVRGLALGPTPTEAVSVVPVALGSDGAAMFTELGEVGDGRCVTDGDQAFIQRPGGMPQLLRLPVALSGTSWTTAWFGSEPVTGVSVPTPWGDYLLAGGEARRRAGSARDDAGGGLMATHFDTPCANGGGPVGNTTLGPTGWIHLVGRRGDIIEPSSYTGGTEELRRFKGIRLTLDDEPLPIPDGLALLDDPELIRRHDRLMAQQTEREVAGRTKSLVGLGLGLGGVGLIAAAGAVNRDAAANGYTDAKVTAEVLTRTVGIISVVLSVPIFISGSKEWANGGRYVGRLRRHRWDLLYSTGELTRAVQRHNRRLSERLAKESSD